MAAGVSKNDFIDRMAEESGLSKGDAEKALKAYHEVMTSILSSGESVAFVGFGTYSTSDRAARTGRNPQTGEAIQIAASRVARFKAGKRLKDAVNNK